MVLKVASSCICKIRTEGGLPLVPTLFTREVIAGMVEMQGKAVAQQDEPPLRVYLLSDVEAVVEFSERIDLRRTITWMSPLQHWLGKKVQLTCRPASPDEVEHARRHDEEKKEDPTMIRGIEYPASHWWSTPPVEQLRQRRRNFRLNA